MARKIVTLYIDDNSLRLMVTRGNRIKKWAELPLDLGSAKLNAAVKEAEIAAKLKQLFRSQKVRTKKVIVGLSGLHCLSRPLILPPIPRAMLAEAVMREARRVLPVPPEQLYISWQTIPAPEGQTQVFLIAIPRKNADALLKILRQVGLKPQLMDIKPLALARVVKEKTAIIIDVQPTEFDVVIMSDGVPQPIRTIPFPDKSQSLPDKLLRIRDDLSRTIEFFNSNNPEHHLAPSTTIFVSGELADAPELCRALSNELEYPVMPLSSPLDHPEQFDPANYLVNIGLALKELRKEAGPSLANLDALPAPYQPKHISLVKVAAVPGAIAIIGVLVLMTMYIRDASANITSLSSQLDTTNQILKQRQAQKKELADSVAALEQKLAAASTAGNTFTRMLDSLNKQGNVINGDLAETTDSLPGTVRLYVINHAGGKLTIQGNAPSELEILDYARNLEDSGRFSEVVIASILRREGEGAGMNFTLALKVKGQD